MTSDTPTSYDPLLRRIHWITAVLFIAAMLIGHGSLAYFVYAVLALHIAASLWHVLVKKDETLARMWPSGPAPTEERNSS